MAKVDRQGLCDERNVELFIDWYTLGGVERGLSLTEIISMPTTMRKDFRYILGMMGTRRRERKHAKEVFEPPPKPGAKKGKRR